MLSGVSGTGSFPDADLIEHSTLPSFWNCSDGKNTIGGGLLSVSHDDANFNDCYGNSRGVSLCLN